MPFERGTVSFRMFFVPRKMPEYVATFDELPDVGLIYSPDWAFIRKAPLEKLFKSLRRVLPGLLDPAKRALEEEHNMDLGKNYEL